MQLLLVVEIASTIALYIVLKRKYLAVLFVFVVFQLPEGATCMMVSEALDRAILWHTL